MSRIERLINLSAALLSAERPLRAEELRERISGYPDDKGSFRRQFERDKEALRELGLPLETIIERRANENIVAYRVNADEYYVRDPGLEPDELSALHLASRLVEIEGLDTGSGLWKLNAAARAERRRRAPAGSPGPDHRGPAVNDAPTVPTASLPADGRLTDLFGLIASGSSVHFMYRGEDRHVQPRRLSFSRAHWYLIAFDLGRADDRSFRLDRMDGDLRADDPAPTPPPSDSRRSGFSRPWELGPAEGEQTAVVLIDAAQAPWAVRHVGAASVVRHRPDGSVELALTVRNVESFRTFVLGFLHHAEVLSPPELRREIIRWLTDIGDEAIG